MDSSLLYVSSDLPGFSRRRAGKGFYYLDEKGKKINDGEILARIRKLRIPPAWESVWICPHPRGHLQATGIDTRGRKQYIYHPAWKESREQTKYANLLLFGKKLPMIRKQMKKDLRKAKLDKTKVTAIALTVMEQTFMRVGNSYYRREYGSHGLTTLKARQLKINGSAVSFQFRGKKGVLHKISCTDPRIARWLKKIKDLPGQELLQYYDDEGELRSLGSGDINEYLMTCTGERFTSKDYRTWAGSVHALKEIATCYEFGTKAECEENILKVIDRVAAKLGNTRAVCRKYYIYPPLFDAYREQRLKPLLQRLKRRTKRGKPAWLENEEKLLLRLLKQGNQES